MTRPVALVTGASAGLGVDFARQLSADGARLVLVARRKDRLDALAAELGGARAVELDLSVPEAARRLMADLQAHGEHVDLLVNNAGFGLAGQFADQEPARLRQMIDLNCGVLTDLARAVVPGMIERRRGGILNVASTAAFQPGPGMAAYFATKSYVLSLSEALHEELKPHGVRVTCLCPGPTRTEFGEVAGWGGRFNKAMERIAMDSAPVVAAGLNGLQKNQAIVVTGGLNKAGAVATRFLPRALVRRIAGSLKM
ncbi:SDR family NAD(P)-dependent oxidoreductase [Sphingomonas sp. GCM10030256]|uniref:SDR family NAD(P)-dependent oxidoreductase n=1 Tax=Sphingomonas sp. GCM10030256 TaxID=3273427 RepID=UPI00361C2992